MLSDELHELLTDLRASGTEDRYVEAKRARDALPKRLWETLSAFSNTRGGGVVLLGVDEADDFAVSGVVDAAKVQSDLASLCDQMEPPLRLRIDRFEVEGSWVVVAEVPELPYTDKPCFYTAAGLGNGVFLRVADGDRKASAYEVQLLREGRGQPLHDLEPVVAARLADLDGGRLGRLLADLRARPGAPWASWDDTRILRTFHVVVDHAGELVPTLAGWLCFAPYPQEHFPQLAVALVRYPTERAGERGPGGERFLDNRLIEGPLPFVVAETLRAAKLNMQRRGIVHGLYREDLWEYPEEVLREAIVNAVVHRDLSPGGRGSQVQVQIYPDRLEVTNPGGLFGPLSLDDLGEPGHEATRNGHLMRLVSELSEDGTGRRLCENRGTGVAVMVARLREAGMAPPAFRADLARFTVRFDNHTLFDEATLAWVHGVLGERGGDRQRRVLAWLHHAREELDNATYRRLTGVDSRVATRELRELVDLGVLDVTGARRWARYALAGAGAPSTQATLDLGTSPIRRGRQDRREVIVALLRAHGPLTRIELAEHLGLTPQAVGAWLRRLIAARAIEPMSPVARSPQQRYQACVREDMP